MSNIRPSQNIINQRQSIVNLNPCPLLEGPASSCDKCSSSWPEYPNIPVCESPEMNLLVKWVGIWNSRLKQTWLAAQDATTVSTHAYLLNISVTPLYSNLIFQHPTEEGGNCHWHLTLIKKREFLICRHRQTALRWLNRENSCLLELN